MASNVYERLKKKKSYLIYYTRHVPQRIVYLIIVHNPVIDYTRRYRGYYTDKCFAEILCEEKENAVIYIISGFRSGRTREPVTFMCAPLRGVSPPASQLVNHRSEQSSIIVTGEIPLPPPPRMCNAGKGSCKFGNSNRLYTYTRRRSSISVGTDNASGHP